MHIMESSFAMKKPLTPQDYYRIEKKINQLPGVLKSQKNRDYRSIIIAYDCELCSEEEINAVIGSMDPDENAGFSFISIIVILVVYTSLFILNVETTQISQREVGIYILAAALGIFTPFYKLRYDEEFGSMAAVSQRLFNNPAISRNPLFILGRVFMITLLGGVWAYLGYLVKMSFSWFPLLQVAISLYMIILALYVLGVKNLRAFHTSLPIFMKNWTDRPRNRFYLGVKSAFIPGITLQILQLFSFGLGLTRVGLLSMFLYITSTIPFMMSHQVITHAVPKEILDKVSRTIGFFVLILAFILILEIRF